MINVEEVRRRIKISFENSGISYGELASKTGYNKSALHRYINGDTDKIPLEAVITISTSIGVDPLWVMCLTEKEAPTSESVLTEYEQNIVNLAKAIPEEKRKDFINYLQTAVKMMK